MPRRAVPRAVVAVAIALSACSTPVEVAPEDPTRKASAGGLHDPTPPRTAIGNDRFSRQLDEQYALRRLSDPILDCIERTDTEWPVFNGCIDWHSAAHAVFALNVIHLHAEDADLRARVEEALSRTLNDDSLAEELHLLSTGQLDSRERPYGFAWLLWADTARDQAFGDDDLHELAVEAAERLSNWLFTEAGEREMLSSRYDSATWAALSLHRWFVHFGESAEADVIARLMASRVDDELVDAACSQVELSGFFSACHMLVFMMTDLGIEVPDSVIDRLLRQPVHYSGDLGTAHGAGLNFSRSWALWAVSSGDCGQHEAFAKASQFVVEHLRQPGSWRDDYRAHAHWVPQFGVLSTHLAIGAKNSCE